jgi:hypothetical protein
MQVNVLSCQITDLCSILIDSDTNFTYHHGRWSSWNACLEQNPNKIHSYVQTSWVIWRVVWSPVPMQDWLTSVNFHSHIIALARWPVSKLLRFSLNCQTTSIITINSVSSMILCPNHMISLTGYCLSSCLSWHIGWQDSLGKLYRSTHLSTSGKRWILTLDCWRSQSMTTLGRSFSYFTVVTKIQTYDSYRTSPKAVSRQCKHLFKTMKTVPL